MGTRFASPLGGNRAGWEGAGMREVEKEVAAGFVTVAGMSVVEKEVVW